MTMKAVKTLARALPAIILACLASLAPMASAAPPSTGDWEASARQADDAYWQAYNRADPDAMNAFLDDDVEFYHDRGGTLRGKAALSQANEAMRHAPDKLRREAVPGTVRFFPMRQGDTIYGVLVSGEHRFHVRPKGKPEFQVGQACFTQLMLQKGGGWKISRIFSYEHVDTAGARAD
jgi:ketosteroid isomerase-like protein